MARIVRQRTYLSGKKRKRQAKLTFIATAVPAPPPAGVPNKDFLGLTRKRSNPQKKHKVDRRHRKRQRKQLLLSWLQSRPTSTLVPEVEFILLASAQAILTTAGLSYHVTFKPSLLYPVNTVTKQTPPRNTQVALGTVIQLEVSSGAALVPQEIGRRIEDALVDLIALGLLPQVSLRATTKSDPGLVLDQQPPKGDKVLVGSIIYLTVSIKPPPGAARAELPSTGDIVNVVTQVI